MALDFRNPEKIYRDKNKGQDKATVAGVFK
jgi:hypothetical protein